MRVEHFLVQVVVVVRGGVFPRKVMRCSGCTLGVDESHRFGSSGNACGSNAPHSYVCVCVCPCLRPSARVVFRFAKLSWNPVRGGCSLLLVGDAAPPGGLRGTALRGHRRCRQAGVVSVRFPGEDDHTYFRPFVPRDVCAGGNHATDSFVR